MTVKELIKELNRFPDYEVTITDGYQAVSYKGAYQIKAFEENDGTMSIDIGVGGLNCRDKMKNGQI